MDRRAMLVRFDSLAYRVRESIQGNEVEPAIVNATIELLQDLLREVPVEVAVQTVPVPVEPTPVDEPDTVVEDDGN